MYRATRLEYKLMICAIAVEIRLAPFLRNLADGPSRLVHSTYVVILKCLPLQQGNI